MDLRIPATMATLALVLSPATAGAIEPASEVLPGRAQTPNVKCETIKGNPALEHAQHEAPPPTTPDGEPYTPPAEAGPCPPGTVGVSRQENRPAKHASPFGLAAPPEAGSANTGYFYVGDVWEGKLTAARFDTQWSAPVLPATSDGSAHSISQMLLAREADRYTLEQGWTKEHPDEVAGYKSAALFFFLTADNYGPQSCYDCGLVLAEGVSESPYGKHFKATDGTPGSECAIEGVPQSPCTGVIEQIAMHYKGAWWLWWASKWVGRISDESWGRHFTKAEEAQAYGEVYDTPNAPKAPMGNGNKGGCLCATEMRALVLGTKVAGSSQPKYKQASFHNPIRNVNWLPTYAAGNFNTGREAMHFGGTP